jgi:hypothetical protein
MTFQGSRLVGRASRSRLVTGVSERQEQEGETGLSGGGAAARPSGANSDKKVARLRWRIGISDPLSEAIAGPEKALAPYLAIFKNALMILILDSRAVAGESCPR